jgi:hypothetical protein
VSGQLNSIAIPISPVATAAPTSSAGHAVAALGSCGQPAASAPPESSVGFRVNNVQCPIQIDADCKHQRLAQKGMFKGKSAATFKLAAHARKCLSLTLVQAA